MNGRRSSIGAVGVLARVRSKAKRSVAAIAQRHARHGPFGAIIARFGPASLQPSPPDPFTIWPGWSASPDLGHHPIIQNLAPDPVDGRGPSAWRFHREGDDVMVSSAECSVRVASMTPPGTPASPVDGSIARPVLFPQRGSGTLDLNPQKALSAAESLRSIRRTCGHERVVVSSPSLVDPRVVRAVITLAAAGAPLELSRPLAPGDCPLGPETTAAVSARPSSDARERELRSVAIRRSAIREHGLETHLGEVASRLRSPESVRRPTVSVVLSSRRPGDLLAAIDQVSAQDAVDVELVVGLHGPAWSADWKGRVSERWTGPLEVITADESVSFGDLLSRLGRRSQGDLVTKWDDDDWYGSHHLSDLAAAHRYSGAAVVGKAAEFVYLTGRDLTVRRYGIGAETYGTTLAGGTLLASRDWFEQLGWWPSMSRGVDLHLIRATLDAGGRVYRTHGFEYVLRRQIDRDSHTWPVADSYFERTADDVRSGLDLPFAGIWPTP